MITVYCPSHRAEVMLGPSSVRRVTNIAGLIVIELECTDGERVFHYSGRRFHEFVRATGRRARLPQASLS